MIQCICDTCGKQWEKEGYGGGIPSHGPCEECHPKLKAAIAEGRRTGTDPAILIDKLILENRAKTPEPTPVPMLARTNDCAD